MRQGKHKQLACIDCPGYCCDDIVLRLREGVQGEVEPDVLPTGTWIFAAALIFEKKANGKWKCRAFDARSKLCRIYKYRPPLCRSFWCPSIDEEDDSIGKCSLKLPINYKANSEDSVYEIVFTFKHRKDGEQHE